MFDLRYIISQATANLQKQDQYVFVICLLDYHSYVPYIFRIVSMTRAKEREVVGYVFIYFFFHFSISFRLKKALEDREREASSEQVLDL